MVVTEEWLVRELLMENSFDQDDIWDSIESWSSNGVLVREFVING